MAFIRKRQAGGGGFIGLVEPAVSTTLVESYRDAEGRPRQRVLANMHGEETTLAALAKIAAMRDRLRKEKADLDNDQTQFRPTYESWMQAIGTGCSLTKTEKRTCDKVVKIWKTMQKRPGEIKNRIAKLNREGAAIKKHCAASADEIQTAIRAHKKQIEKAEALMMFNEFSTAKGKRQLQRLMA